MEKIDINCDLAEGGESDAELMSLISSCNIACGGHFGTKATVNEAVRLAMKNKVNIGAHPSYPDKANFGRTRVAISLQELEKSLLEQIILLQDEVKSQNGKLQHIKPHGALYHDLAVDKKAAELFINIVKGIDEQLALFAPPYSILHKLAKGKLTTYTEGFADRSYDRNYRLLSRSESKAVVQEKEKVSHQVLTMIKDKKIPIDNDRFLACDFDTICIHGDHPNAVEILLFLHKKFKENNIQITSL